LISKLSKALPLHIFLVVHVLIIVLVVLLYFSKGLVTKITILYIIIL